MKKVSTTICAANAFGQEQSVTKQLVIARPYTVRCHSTRAC